MMGWMRQAYRYLWQERFVGQIRYEIGLETRFLRLNTKDVPTKNVLSAEHWPTHCNRRDLFGRMRT
jgi:hypothetical protein